MRVKLPCGAGLLAAALAACSGAGGPPATQTDVTPAMLTLRTPSSELQAAFVHVRAMHPEWSGLALAQIDAHWDVEPVAPANGAAASPEGAINQFVCGQPGYTDAWTTVGGVQTPPNCTNTGTLRRVFSVCCKSGMEADITLTSSTNTMPHGPDQFDSTTGFIYEEGWPNAARSNSEAGFEYSAASDSYNLYLASPHYTAHAIDLAVRHGATVNLEMDGTTSGVSTLPVPTAKAPAHSCSGGCVQGVYSIIGANCPAGKVCASLQKMWADGWGGNCCFVARVTSIARNTPWAFTAPSPGYVFGPVPWSNAYTHTTSGTEPSFAYAGKQSYPNNSQFVKFSGAQPPVHGEADTIFEPIGFDPIIR